MCDPHPCGVVVVKQQEMGLAAFSLCWPGVSNSWALPKNDITLVSTHCPYLVIIAALVVFGI